MTPDQVAEKMKTVEQQIQRKAILESKLEDVVKEIKEKCDVADGKELKAKIEKLKNDKDSAQRVVETKCAEYEALEAEIGV